MQLTDFLPTTKKECELRGWTELDIILFSGDAYVDHPSFGAAVIGRTLENAGYRVAIVPQPDWHGDFRDFKKLGRPRLFFGISPAVWTLWSINIRQTSDLDPRMPILQTVVMTAVRKILPSSIRAYCASFSPMCRLFSVVSRQACVVLPIMIIGMTAFASAYYAIPLVI